MTVQAGAGIGLANILCVDIKPLFMKTFFNAIAGMHTVLYLKMGNGMLYIE